MDADAFFTRFAICLVALVIYLTLLVMLVLRPRNRMEWATTGKEIGFGLIMASALYSVFEGRTTPQPWRALLFGGASILLITYLIIFFVQWLGPTCRWCHNAFDPYPWIALVIATVFVLGMYVFARLVVTGS